MALSTEQQILIEQRVTNDGKSMLVAYFLLIFLGGLGVHRFYLGKVNSGIAMLVMFVLGWFTLLLHIGIFLFAIVGVWALVDLFLVPGMVKEDKQAIRKRLGEELALSGGNQ